MQTAVITRRSALFGLGAVAVAALTGCSTDDDDDDDDFDGFKKKKKKRSKYGRRH